MTDYVVISDHESFLRACADLASGTGPVAVDVERASGFRYSQRAYLVQVCRTGASTYLFDPTGIADFAPLQEAIGELEWIFHAASQDLPSLRELGLDPRSIFDTEVAARLLGYERVGLGAVVEHTLDIVLKKEHSASDWSTRPLPVSWLEYAALDFVHLVQVRDVLAGELEESGKTEFAAQEFSATLAREPKAPVAEPWRKLKGLHTLRGPKNLAIARALWQARENLAQELDTSPGRLIPDASLVAAVAAAPASRGALAGLSAFNGRASRTYLDRWWDAIVAGRADTDLPRERVRGDSLPPPRAWADRNPEADARLKAAKPLIDAHAEELGMPIENLLTPDYLRRIAWEPPGLSEEAIAEGLARLGARPWQIEQTVQKIAAAFVEAAQSADDTTPTDS